MAEATEVTMEEALKERCAEGRVREAQIKVVHYKEKGMGSILQAMIEDADPATYLSRLLDGMLAPEDVDGHAEVGKISGGWHAAVQFRPILNDEEMHDIGVMTGQLAAQAAESAWKDGFVAGLIYARMRRNQERTDG